MVASTSMARQLNQVVRPILGAGELAGDFGVPFIGGAVGVVKEIQESCEKVIVHKHECQRLSNKAAQLLVVFEERSPHLKESDLRIYADDMESTLHKINKRMRRWAQMGRIRAYLQDTKVSEQIKDSNAELDMTINRFQMNSLISINSIAERVEMRVEHTHRSIIEYIELLSGNPERAVLEIQELERRGEHISIPIMEQGQSQLRFIRERQQSHMQTSSARPNSTVSRRFSTEYAEIQRGLTELYRRMGVPPTIKTLDGEITREGDLPIAGGAYSDVWIGYWLGQTKVALKALRGIRNTTPKAERRFERELKVWSQLDHSNILKFLGVTADVGNFLHMVSPWQDNGNILDFTLKNPDANRHHLLAGAAAGLAYLHEKQVVHGNMRCSNVLVSASGEALICDFGVSKLLEEVTEQSASATLTKAGSARWLAPELIKGDLDSPTKACDVYSFGMTMYECLSAEAPFARLKRDATVIQKVVTEAMRPARPEVEWVTDEVWAVVVMCWEGLPEVRPEMGVVKGRLAEIDEGSNRESTATPTSTQSPQPMESDS